MRFKAALEGDLKKHMKEEYHTAERAVTLGIREATNGLKMSMVSKISKCRRLIYYLIKIICINFKISILTDSYI